MIEATKIILLLGIVFGSLIVIFAEPLCYLLTGTSEVVSFAKQRLLVLASTYFFCGIMDVFSYTLRGMGKSFTAMVVSLLFACFFRIAWVLIVFPIDPNIVLLSIAWPVSWILTTIVDWVLFGKAYKQLKLKKINN